MTTIVQGTTIVRRDIMPQPLNTTPIGAVPANCPITGDRKLNQWIHLTSINGAPYLSDGWVSTGSNNQYINWKYADVEQPSPSLPPPEPPVITRTHVIEVYSDGSIHIDGQPYP